MRSALAAPWLSVTLVLAAALGLWGCASVALPVRADRPLQPPPARLAAVAEQVSVSGRQGRRLDQRQREAVLQQVGQQGSAPALQRHLAAQSAADADVHLHSGNQARLLIDGPSTFAAMFEAIEQARHSVLLESYIIEHGEIAQQLAALLKRKRAQGVPVAVIYDALGSIGTDTGYFDGLRSAGIAVCAFNPVIPLQRTGYWDISHRDHRKILVVDRQTAFTGGINISEVYASGSSGAFSRARRAANPSPQQGWRDTQILLRGSAAPALEDLLRATWQQQGCEPALPPPASDAPRAAGQQLVRIVPATPDDGFNPIYAMLLTAIDSAQRSVYLTMAYFAPGEDMVAALCDAARRGVDVQLLLPSVSDFTPVLHAGRSYYDRLLEAGVKLHELQDAVLHAKTAVIDGVVSTVGSSNMDWRSFVGNNEVNAVVFGEDFGDTMTRMFRQDLAAAQPITLEAWRARPLWQRARERLAHWFERWW
jgi:cardiolipin synthase A/B